MTTSQRLQLELSKVRTRLNAISGMESLDEDTRTELTELESRYQDLEAQHRAAILSEGGPSESENTGEGAELRALTRRAKLANYLAAATNGQPVDGAEAELREAYGIKDASTVPWAAIAPHEVEERADAATPAPSTLPRQQDEIMARVFPMSATNFLGVDMPRVGVGESAYPVLTGGTTVSTQAKGAGQDAVAGSFGVLNLTPRRLTARYLFSVEDLAVLKGMESALREDLTSALMDGLDDAILNGNATAPNVTGIIGGAGQTGGLTAPVAVTAESSYTSYLETIGSQIDGRYAHRASDIKMLIGGGTAAHMIQEIQAGSGTSAYDAVTRLVGDEGLRVSGHIAAPGAATKNQTAVVRRGNNRTAVAPLWEGIRLIRDEITRAGTGEIAITAVALYSFGFKRTDEYKLVAFNVGS